MTIWRNLATSPPLNDDRDVMARVGFRFLWCTVPFRILALIFAAADNGTLLTSPFAAATVALPVSGGLIDRYRVNHRREANRQAV